MIHEFENCPYQMDFESLINEKDHIFPFDTLKEKENVKHLFDVILEWRNRRPRNLSNEKAIEFNMELMYWTKKYADEILDKLVGFNL